jgi:phosphohistidine swiveling domain-containing protein/DNA-binding Xre family transcriptional regulator
LAFLAKYDALLPNMHLKLGNLLRQTGKSVLQIARETGLNRNTITTLMHDKEGDGLRLSTLEVFHKTYGWSIADMIENAPPITSNSAGSKRVWYRQEGELIPITCWPWLISSCHPFGVPHIPEHAEEGRFYARKDYGYVYWPEETFLRWAKHLYQKYAQPEQHNSLYQAYLKTTHPIEELYLSIQEPNTTFTLSSLEELYKTISEYYQHFWNSSLFIDAFDVGVDQEIIQAKAKENGLTKEEVKILLTTRFPTFDRERRQDLVRLAQGAARTRLPFSEWLRTSAAVHSHLRHFRFARNNYARIGSYGENDIAEELRVLMQNPAQAKNEAQSIHEHTRHVDKEVKAILKERDLRENPLSFFQLLTYWREHRKKINLMGIHVLLTILEELEKHIGIPKELLAYLAPEEVASLARGTISKETLETRRNEGLMIIMTVNGYRLVVGKEAQSLREECETETEGSATKDTILNGQIACQGYAKGTARIMLSEVDFTRFKDGDILVTSMTRPEFVPLMRRATGIVTNEGGITCHAAIVSRELGKPCLIGTRRATEVIKEGDLIEVRAHHGTVRILERA